jgi:predicted O-linked N-acetylglucosamine transferase (SPINDLY family)
MLAKFVRSLFRSRDDGDRGVDSPDGLRISPVSGAGEGAECTSAELLQRAAAMTQSGQLNAALEIYRACLQAYPQSLDACVGAAGVLVDLWSIDEAVAMYARALQIAPASSAIFSAWLFHRHYMTPVDAQQLSELHQRFGALMRKAIAPSRDNFTQTPDAERRLRIGYLSPNFSRHSVGYFIEPVIRCHDRRLFDVFCYYTHPMADDATARMRELADGWRDVAGDDDSAVERMIREDRIDILVDLAGHSKGNRLGVFARRPAPVQMTWLGYPDTTGLATVDWRITDGTADPEPDAGGLHSETLLRLDNCFLCYQPPLDAPPVAVRASGAAVIFSSFNNIAKLNDATIRIWGQILAGVPGSRLALKASSLNYPDTVDRVLEGFERCDIDPARVDVHGWIAGRRQHLELYGGIDIALDTFPYNGTTTSCEALWMGVPVVTLAGDVHMSRVGATILRCAGLDELVAHDAADYVNIAVALARDEVRRHSLRTGLRSRLLASPLLDHAGFSRGLEARCRSAWRAWCNRQRVA